jgi:hypothetical protein
MDEEDESKNGPMTNLPKTHATSNNLLPDFIVSPPLWLRLALPLLTLVVNAVVGWFVVVRSYRRRLAVKLAAVTLFYEGGMLGGFKQPTNTTATSSDLCCVFVV